MFVTFSSARYLKLIQESIERTSRTIDTNCEKDNWAKIVGDNYNQLTKKREKYLLMQLLAYEDLL